jgi:hypothetical protein
MLALWISFYFPRETKGNFLLDKPHKICYLYYILVCNKDYSLGEIIMKNVNLRNSGRNC